MCRDSLKQRDDVEGCKMKGEIVHIRANVHLSNTRLQFFYLQSVRPLSSLVG